VLGVAVILALLGAALTEWIGVHALLGAFLAGVAFGDSSHLRERTRATIDQFVTAGLAPLFFTTIGLSVDFAANFDLGLTALLIAIACAGKILGCAWGAARAGMERREAWAVGFAMNARGAMEIVLGMIALRAGLIGERLFVALVVMALVTSMMSGPLMARVLRRPRARRLAEFVMPRSFVAQLAAADRGQAIAELCATLAPDAGLPAAELERAVLARERLQAAGVGAGVAVPRARLRGLREPLVAVGIAREGVDFDAPDGEPARLVFLILTPPEDGGAQLQLLAEIGRVFGAAATREQALAARSAVELQALLRIEAGGG
jgi:mannitol/fructose-specific phosphotransferase system IIA component (Ntr-type)